MRRDVWNGIMGWILEFGEAENDFFFVIDGTEKKTAIYKKKKTKQGKEKLGRKG